MNNNSTRETTPQSTDRSAGRLVNAAVALAALGGAGYLAKTGLDMANAATDLALLREHAPALLGLPVLAALATAIVCGARALDTRSQVEIIGLRADGAGAIILSWVLVFSALVVTLRALW
ncbi:hypothetical protein [Parvibaculum sp.]|uniref:hypothetical protein n=1 Tax=Parvibaculum sp. TaxID=2024848 RepID=UPI00320C73D0